MSKPKKFDRNIIVIGAGAAGLVSAYISAAVKARVTLVESGNMGGDCLNTGCVPSKALIQCARVAHSARVAKRFGVVLPEPEIDFPAVMAHVRNSIQQIEPHDSVERYNDLGVEVVRGRGRLVDPWTVNISRENGTEQTLTARAIILATGAEPAVPRFPGLEAVNYLTSETLWDRFAQLDKVPSQLLLLGGGAIGCELAQAFTRLGSKVTLIERAERLLPLEDHEVSAAVTQALESEGVRLLTAHEATAFAGNQSGQGGAVTLRNAQGEIQVTFDEVILALGRHPRTEGLGLEELGIVQNGKCQVDDYLRTRYPHILAAGDLAGPYQFTHTAAHQAWYAAVNGLFGDIKKFAVDYSLIPSAIFIDPQVASVGLTEHQAIAQGVAYEVTHYGIDDLDRAIVDGAATGFVKVLTAPGRDKILGVCIVGENAAELIAEFVFAMKQGFGLNKILSTIHIYPTMAEANKYVAGNWKRAHAPKNLLRWLEKFHRWRRG
ncbi:dihydrolipoyl dehydrogenase family protein [Microbulbifer variabilis]|uniref:dihydrolipoyl dehydrogenase family protein n=1 Tax=Microbulbifer variabilis TaxID=266805 RepID=UPI001CFC6937|nr:FAD-dependent oxidoreductase [Microbulbifer variabilis]